MQQRLIWVCLSVSTLACHYQPFSVTKNLLRSAWYMFQSWNYTTNVYHYTYCSDKHHTNQTFKIKYLDKYDMIFFIICQTYHSMRNRRWRLERCNKWPALTLLEQSSFLKREIKLIVQTYLHNFFIWFLLCIFLPCLGIFVTVSDTAGSVSYKDGDMVHLHHPTTPEMISLFSLDDIPLNVFWLVYCPIISGPGLVTWWHRNIHIKLRLLSLKNH